MSTTLPTAQPIEWRLLYDAPCSLYTHPRQLAACAIMSGHEPPSLEGARILEVGSALGGNLTPIAASLPTSECIGVDPFTEQTTQANVRAQQAGVTNVTYLPIGVGELDEVEGEFDYIICHGLLSWIPFQAQEETYELCAKRLSPQGLAYISYNTYPKWHQLMYVRDALRWRGQHLKNDESFEEESRRALSFFAAHSSTMGEASTRAIFSQAHQNLAGKPDYYLAHEYLLEENHPFYFHEVMRRSASAGGAEGHGLCYLADLSLNVQLAYAQLNKSLQRELLLMGDSQLALQQNLDFLHNRSLRRSLFIRSDAPRAGGVKGCPPFANPTHKQLAPTFTLSQLSTLSITSNLQPVSVHNFSPSRPQEWRHRHTGARRLITDPLAQCVLLLASAQWPQALNASWPEQAGELYESFVGHSPTDEQWRSTLNTMGYLELIAPPMSRPPMCLSTPPSRTGALPLAAPHLTTNYTTLKEVVVPTPQWQELTNIYHETTLASPLLSAILPALSGHCTRDELVSMLDQLVCAHPELVRDAPRSGAEQAWPTGGLESLSATDQLYYLLQEAYELALLIES